jgi:hypothetical protein
MLRAGAATGRDEDERHDGAAPAKAVAAKAAPAKAVAAKAVAAKAVAAKAAARKAAARKAAATKTGRAPARAAGRLGISVAAAISGTLVTSLLSGSPQFRLAAAAVGASIPAFATEPGRHQ